MITEKRQHFLLGAEPWGKSSCRSELGVTAQHGAAGLSTAAFIMQCLRRSVLNRQSSGVTSLRGLNYLLSPFLRVMAGITGHRGAANRRTGGLHASVDLSFHHHKAQALTQTNSKKASPHLGSGSSWEAVGRDEWTDGVAGFPEHGHKDAAGTDLPAGSGRQYPLSWWDRAGWSRLRSEQSAKVSCLPGQG